MLMMIEIMLWIWCENMTWLFLDLQPKHQKKKSAAALNAEMRKPAWEDPDDEDNTQK